MSLCQLAKKYGYFYDMHFKKTRITNDDIINI